MSISNPTSQETSRADEITLQEQDCVSLEDTSLPAAQIFTAQIDQALEQENSVPLYIP